MNSRTPLQSLLFLLLVGLLAMITMWVFPKNGIPLNNSLTLRYESLNELFGAPEDSSSLNFDSLLAATGIDSVALRDSLNKAEKARLDRVTGIQHPDSSINSLHDFYDELLAVRKKGGKIRILHYGDSQIEGDRMTRYLRNEWQKEFGGSGPGFFPAFQVIKTSAVQQAQSDNWLRYTAYGKKDTTLQHRNYGILASFSRFCPPPDSLPPTDTLSAWLQLQPAAYGYYRLKKFSQLKLLLGGNTSPVEVGIFADSVKVLTKVINANNSNQTIKVAFKKTPGLITINFKGLDSPNIYALSLESSKGVIVDNIPLRGASGTLFRGINKNSLKTEYNQEPIRLVILQFGGNSVPYIDTKERAENYGNYFKANLSYLKALLPKASFLVVGPSDMATKIKGVFKTYPMLETIRDQVQQAAFANGMAYYDMYEVMGGKNSMPRWVTASPPLAGADYVHFTSKGAQKMGKSLYEAIHSDFLKYQGIRSNTLQIVDTNEK